ncbi:MAG: hypothetical protein R3Y47_02065 [Lachnospiraceae bacterium]
MIFRKKCPYCGNQLHIERTSPTLKYGCTDCMKLSNELLAKGLSKQEVEKIIKRGR